MFVDSQINARPIGVLLGGTGTCQSVAQQQTDVGVLLRPRKAYSNRDASGSASVIAANALWKMNLDDELYHMGVSALVIEAAKDDPELVLGLIRQLKQSGDIDVDALTHVEQTARKWIKISRDNLKKVRR